MDKRVREGRREQGRLARAWAFTKRHALPIGLAAGGAVLTVVGFAMPASARKSIADGVKGLFGSDGARKAATAAAATAAVAVKTVTEQPVERTFMGITESRLNELAQTLWHGVSARFDEFGHLVFRYTSNSGKTMMSALLSEENGGIAINQGLCDVSNRSSLPGAFADLIFEESAKAAQA